MLRTTIMLPPELKHRAELRARDEGVSLGELVRRALEHAISAAAPNRRDDPLFSDREVFSGDAPPDVTRDHDRHLYGTDE